MKNKIFTIDLTTNDVEYNLTGVKNVYIYNTTLNNITVREGSNSDGITLLGNGVYVLYGISGVNSGFSGIPTNLTEGQDVQLFLSANVPTTVTLQIVY